MSRSRLVLRRCTTMALLGTVLVLSACASLSGGPTGVVNGKLQPCPPGPHCVSSDESRAEFKIDSLRIANDADATWRELKAHLTSLPRAEVVDEKPDYLHLTFTSRWFRFTDDVEFLLHAKLGEIAMRSSSRLGYYDFGVNRDRLESIRAALREKSLVK